MIQVHLLHLNLMTLHCKSALYPVSPLLQQVLIVDDDVNDVAGVLNVEVLLHYYCYYYYVVMLGFHLNLDVYMMVSSSSWRLAPRSQVVVPREEALVLLKVL